MFGIMAHSAFILVLFFLCPIALQQTLPPEAVNPERINLLKEALSCMTFRKNGQLASEQDLEPFFEALKERYLKSKHYRTMIIAFSKGVLAKMTLKENDRCNPDYPKKYKDSFNNSVTNARLKEFIFGSYDQRLDVWSPREFCDYRDGLICSPLGKCECPVGSKMEPISQGSKVQRCLLQQDQVCALIDLDHDPNSNYGALKRNLPEMILNLEKPLSCKMGTQCRFKTNATQTTPLCYGVNNGPWDKGKWSLNIGEECTLGLHVDIGQCITRDELNYTQLLGNFGGYTCFNFGPRSQPRSPSVGFCAHEMGSYAVYSQRSGSIGSGWVWNFDLQMIGFVSPATTPLRGRSLFKYYNDYLSRVEVYMDSTVDWGLMAPNPGDRCNIDKTEEMLELWKFFKSLKDTLPSGKDYVATEAELWAKYNEAKALTTPITQKVCRFITQMFSNARYIENAL